MAQAKGEYLMLVSEAADGFRATIGVLSFHTFPLSEDRCVRLLLKDLGKRMPESDIREELLSMHIKLQNVMMQLQSRRWDQEAEKDPSLTLHFIVSVERSPDVVKVRLLTDLCGLRK